MPHRIKDSTPPPLPDSFADYPRSISAVRSDKSRLASDWSPRDVVIDFLRELDAGKINPDTVVLIYRDKQPDGNFATGMSSSSPDRFLTLGLFELGRQLFLAGSVPPRSPDVL